MQSSDRNCFFFYCFKELKRYCSRQRLAPNWLLFSPKSRKTMCCIRDIKGNCRFQFDFRRLPGLTLIKLYQMQHFD